MKKKGWMILCLILGIGGVFWVNGGSDVHPERIQREIPAPPAQEKELRSLLDTLLALYNKNGADALVRLFPFSETERKLQMAETGIDPVEHSLAALRRHGRNLSLNDIRCFSVTDSRNLFFVTGRTGNGQILKIGLNKFRSGYGVIGITEL